MVQAQHLISSQNKLGEGPLWHPGEEALYWVDIEQQRVERYQPSAGLRTGVHFSLSVTALGLRRLGGFIAATEKGFGYWDGRTSEVFLFDHPESDKPENRFNDGAVGPDGRFWAGTMRPGPQEPGASPGALYRLDPDSTSRLVEPGLTISNGLGWSPDGKRFYHTDSLRHTIYVYDYDPAGGEVENRRIFVQDPEVPGVPDGLTVDSQGFVWSARWGGWKVTRFDPEGKPEREITLPVACPTSCTFGGTGLNRLYITSAWTALTPAERAEQPQAGDVFVAEFEGITGQLPNRFMG
jgi:sugar lactone lactonase YvrE